MAMQNYGGASSRNTHVNASVGTDAKPGKVSVPAPGNSKTSATGTVKRNTGTAPSSGMSTSVKPGYVKV